MAFGAIGNGVNFVLDKLGLGWLTGATPISPVNSIFIAIDIPDLNPTNPIIHRAAFTLYPPNHGIEFGAIAENMAAAILAKLEFIVALQQVIDEEGGITIKDQLDPYHYEVVKNALEENGEPVPPVEVPEATVTNQLGGAVTEFGLLSAISPAIDALQTVGTLGPLLALPTSSRLPAGVWGNIPANFIGPPLPGGNPDLAGAPPLGPGIVADAIAFIGGSWPDYTYQLQIINSCISIESFVNQYAVSIFRNAIDTEAGALLIKSAMGTFSKDVSDNALNGAGRTPPQWEEPTGAGGIL